jgi:predicted amidohydrolase
VTTIALALLAAALPWQQSGFAAGDPGWSTWSARDEIAPRASVVSSPSRGEPGALSLSGGGNPAACGEWRHRIDGIAAGQWYRLTAHYRAEGVPHESWQVLARLDWMGADGARTGWPDYAYRTAPDGDWRRVTLDAPAPEGAAAVEVQLRLQNAEDGTVYWDDLRLERIPDPGPRAVRLAAVNLRPKDTGGREASVAAFVDLARREVPAETDVILLPEGITEVGTGHTYVEVAEPVPGPTTRTLGALAREKGAYVVAGLYERVGPVVYNTAILLDREGRLAGTYRKVYLPREEIEGGLTPGSSYPVFDTDFGRVGLMICWDTQFADPARALALAGAEVLLVPIWGGNETLVRARAIENRVFVATSGYDFPTLVVDPDGGVLARAEDDDGSVALATIDLNRRYLDVWLGDMKGRFPKELRTEVR